MSGRTSGKVLKNPTRGFFSRMNVEPLVGPAYTLELAHRECYECKYLLPPNIERVPSIILVVVGDVSSGKSHYLASFIHQLKTEWISNSSGFVSFECLTPAVEQKYINEYFEPLFTHQKALPLTTRATSPYAQPLIYELAVSPAPRYPVTVANLLIYDTSGEDYEEQERIVNFARFVLNTNAFIYVVNPVTLAAVYSHLDPSLKVRLQNEYLIGQKNRPAAKLGAILAIYERFHGIPKGTPLTKVPVAVMISKSDLLPNGSTITSYPYYGDGIDLTDINAVDQEVRELLQTHYKQGDLVAATSRLERIGFFAASATGGPPDPSGNFSFVRPLRCLDPVLWILHQLDIVKS